MDLKSALKLLGKLVLGLIVLYVVIGSSAGAANYHPALIPAGVLNLIGWIAVGVYAYKQLVKKEEKEAKKPEE